MRVDFSIGTLDEEVWRITEPGTPHPGAGSRRVARLTEAGHALRRAGGADPAGPLGRPGAAREVVRACVEAGAVSISSIGLHLRPGVRELFMPWLERERPDLVERYDELYGARNGYLARDEQQKLGDRVRALVERHGGCAAARCCRVGSRPPPHRPRSRSRPSRSCASSAEEAPLGSRGMPLQNRVTPLGELVADPARGLVYGNRGCLHDERAASAGATTARAGSRAGSSSAAGSAARCCSPAASPSSSSSTRRPRSPPGHRPCALCRREDYVRFGEIWRELHPRPDRSRRDRRPAARRARRPGTRAQRHHGAVRRAPDGAFVLHDGAPWLVLGAELLRWTPAGYARRTPRPGAATRS